MKKILLLFISTTIIGLIGTVSAQKTIVRSDVEFYGERLSKNQGLDTNSFKALDFAKTGNGITWDMSTAVPKGDITSSKTKTVKPSETPYAAEFPDANFASFEVGDTSESYGYAKITDTDFSMIGAKSKSYTVKFSDPQKYFIFPFKFNDSFEDTYVQDITSSEGTFKMTGKVKVTYDGFGTLKMPAKTFNNVVRMTRVTEMEPAPGFKTISTSYTWMDQANDDLVTITMSKTISSFPQPNTISGSFDPDAVPSSIEENVSGFKFQTTPNPVNEVLTIRLNQPFQTASIQVINMLGQNVWNQNYTNGAGIEQTVNQLPTGIYSVSMTVDGKTAVQKVVVR